jgi:3-phenylpropionate/trans-cinnamate dioxygenase ferredoxin subunit
VTQTRLRVGPVDGFAEGSLTAVTIGNQPVVVVRQDGNFYAVPDRCTHAKFPLHDGELLDGRIKCVHHGATFDLASGRPTLPAVKKLRLFDTEVSDGMLYVTLQEA